MHHPSDNENELQQALQDLLPDTSAPVIEEDILIEIDSAGRGRRSDDQIIARFFGMCLIAIGVVTALPALYFWLVLSGDDTGSPVPRWTWIVGFLAAVHVLYGVYIMQLVDYSAMQMVAIFLLLMACQYGFVGMSLMLGDAHGPISQLLQMPETLKQRGVLWCGIMFGVTALACYLFGREAMVWQRRSVLRSQAGSGQPA